MSQVLLMPVKPKWANLYLAGTKTAEVRRRMIHGTPGDLVAIYATAPTRAVVALASIEGVIQLPSCPPASSYEWFDAYIPASDRTALSGDELRDYLEPVSPTGVGGRGAGCVILLQDIRPLAEPVSLDRLREWMPTFRVPQCLSWLYESQAETLLGLCGAGAVR
jgi:predicted transcriptional regulator